MKVRTIVLLGSLVFSGAGTALAQDPPKVDPAHYKVVFENPGVRVLRITYPVGAKSSMHKHPDAMVVLLGTAKMQFTMPDGKSEEREMPAGSALFTPAVTHNPANIGKTPMDGILVEFKSAAPGTATLPSSRPNMAMKVLAESPRATAFQMTADPSFQEPAGTKHDYDQVVIALSSGQMSLSIDGKPPKTTWARGDVTFIGRGVAHESKNLSGKPIDYVIVAIK
jgi:beta-alanine degradation protein BauB